jgi:MAF protein
LAADTTVILAADTLGIQDGEILEKPADPDHARAMLRQLRDRPHVVATALTLMKIDAANAPAILLTRVTRSTVWMRPYTDDEIEAYIASGEPFDKAGGYAIQDNGFNPVARFEGSYTNIVGLPMETLDDMLSEIDVTNFS